MATDAAPDDRSILAAEFMLGLLEGDALDEARRLMEVDPEFGRDVERWGQHFEHLFARWPEAVPPPSLERRVLAAAGLGAANDATPWKWATGVAGSIAAALAVLLFLPEQRPAPVTPAAPVAPAAPAMAVAFTVTDGNRTMPAVMDMTRHQVRMPRGLEVPEGRVAQLWLIEGEAAPQPIGLFEPNANGMVATMQLNRDLPAGATLAISIEPPGGSPTGLPTGPVVATGELKPV
jgi:anti-sigma-K factor RskA